MRSVIWTDPSGRRWRRGIPNGADDSEGEYGVPMGPPDLADLALASGWSEEVAIALHNQLADRELWDARALRQKPAKGGRAQERIDARDSPPRIVHGYPEP